MISLYIISADYVLIAFATLLGASFGFLLRHIFDVDNQNDKKNITEAPKKDSAMPAMPGGGMGGMDF